MRYKTGHAAPARITTIIPQTAVNELVTLFNTANWPQLEAKARALTQQYPNNALAWLARGKALLQQGRNQEAAQALQRAVQIAPNEADKHGDLGLALFNLGQFEQAERHYRRSVELDPRSTENLNNLATLLNATGRPAQAEAVLQQALRVNAASPATHNNLGNTYRHLKQFELACSHFQQALALAPANLDAWLNLGLTLLDTKRLEEARAAYQQALTLYPDSPIALRCMGRLLTLMGQHDAQAIACLTRAVQLTPDNPDAHIDLGNALLRTGTPAQWRTCFRQAQALRPLVTWPANQVPPTFDALLLDTPGAGSTPVNYLTSDTPYNRHFYCVLPDSPPDIAMLRAKAKVVINIIADADNGAEILPDTLALADALNLPIINHPRVILRTDRESIAQSLKDIPGCKMPLTRRLSQAELVNAAVLQRLDGFSMPMLVRQTGNHGGDAFAKVDNWVQLLGFLNEHGEGQYYVTEFVDYRSSDGCYRKYRLICIDGEILPYHLAIHEDWMVHHFRTDMGQQAWKRQEEAAFLDQPQRVFHAQSWQALQAIFSSTGLDYGGIDCGIDHDGRLLVFEVNATMLVHDEQDPDFVYKNPHVARIKAAFNAMVSRRANAVQAAAA